VVEAVAPRPENLVLEIGPGRGALTDALAPHVRRLIAVEIDRDLASSLSRNAPENVTIITADFLEVDLASVLAGEGGPARVVGNLPYYISSPILFRLLSAARGGQVLADATLMLQREVADRLVAQPGSRDYGVLGILVRLHADVRRVLTLPPGAFRPVPKVNSAVVHLEFRPPPVPLTHPQLFESMVKALFSQRRKTAGNALKVFAQARSLSPAAALHQAGIDPGRRPETLQLPELSALAEVFASAAPPDVL
jgi:16S rRNA (adenine1518-N6/adenine1519-N6)-dimethyltransferase